MELKALRSNALADYQSPIPSLNLSPIL